jgi:hypothetical protein
VKTWRAWLPAMTLITVALTQVLLARTDALSPWKGGGFGMFATTDGTAFRHVRLFVEGPDRSEELKISPSLEDAASRASLHPSERLLTELAEAVVRRERRHGRSVHTVRIEVWRVDFDGEPLKATERRLRSFVLVVPRHES